jgi:hypothetical protein
MSSTMLITYTPQADINVDTSISLLTSAGPMHVPVQCRARFASMSVSQTCVDFGGGVMVGASKDACLRLCNAGALKVSKHLH